VVFQLAKKRAGREKQRMESHQVIRQAVESSNVKKVASQLGMSLSLVYKWMEKDARNQSGVLNPLDRIHQLYEITGHDHLIQWLCHKAGGYFVKNPPTGKRPGREVMPATQEIVQKFADVLSAISDAAADNSISDEEAKLIRHEWDELKRLTERFVKWCEEGDFEHLSEDLASKHLR